MLLQQLIKEKRVDKFDSPEKDADAQEIAALIREHCSNAIPSFVDRKMFYRGWSRSIKSGVYTPESGTRQSQNTTNHYTRLYDTNPANTAFPKRSKSFICTTSMSTALHYTHEKNDGTLSVVIPFDDTVVAMCPTRDIWYGEPEDINKLSINKINLRKLNDILTDVVGWEPVDFDEFVKKVDALDDNSEAINRHFKAGPTLAEIKTALKRAYTYKLNGYELGYAKDFMGEDNREVWFSGKCVMFDYDQSAIIRNLLS